MTLTLPATASLPATALSNLGGVERSVAVTSPADEAAKACAKNVAQGFLQYEKQFRALTAKAGTHFQECDWQNSQQVSFDRDQLFDAAVARTLKSFEDAAGNLALDPTFWQAARQEFALQVEGLHDGGLRRSFFNAVFKSCFESDSMLPRCGFVPISYTDLAMKTMPDMRRIIDCQWAMPAAANELLQAAQIEAEWQNVHVSAIQLSNQIETQWGRRMPGTMRFIEVLDTVFYRFSRAFVIGRFIGDEGLIPFALAISNPEGGAVVDSLLLGETELSDLLGPTHASFVVEIDQVTDAVSYLKVLTPRRQIRDLFAALGHTVD
jgi:isocitrate dehydrogenase kinase/phosphatase